MVILVEMNISALHYLSFIDTQGWAGISTSSPPEGSILTLRKKMIKGSEGAPLF